jgi:antitoxin HigA-1
MEEYFVRRPLKRPPVHPVEILREDVLDNLGLSVSEAAKRLGVSHQH